MIAVTAEQGIVFATLIIALVLFVYGRWRYDIVALLSLFIVTLTGVVGWDEAFFGFANPAVITVAAVLVISRGLQNAGVVDLIVHRLSGVGDGPGTQVSLLTGIVTAFSAFMNNIGALALLLPVGLRMARKSGIAPSILLLPLAFGSCLGGLITLIGTPPNIIIAAFRAEHTGEPFAMFDFAPVGLAVAVAGVLFISLIGWRLVPKRAGPSSREDLFEVKNYLTEVRVTEDSKLAGMSLREIEEKTEADVAVVHLVRGETIRPAPYRYEIVRPGDILIVRADSDDLKAFIDLSGFELAEGVEVKSDTLGSGDVTLVEAMVQPDSPVIGRRVRDLSIRWRFEVNLLAVARQGERLRERLQQVRFEVGDVLLLQGTPGTLQEAMKALGCLPLAERGLKIGEPQRIILSVGIFGFAIAIAAVGLVPIQIIFPMAAVAMVLTSLIPLREVYESIDWPVIVLLGALIPVGQALESTGGARLIASTLLGLQGQVPAEAILVILLVATMFLSDFINNAATAVLMAPIGVSLAGGLGVSTDPFLMAVAVGASCAFLTPIGHQSNTLVMGPGGLRFGDYWRLGLPLETIIVLVAVPLILYVWPL
ncbi:MAG TPA: SLC13 family permease [Methanofollis liminatans]|uniref:SLC13 family permease n=1 Tax=Methanofollis liminatans TaxID=2201 RepID=A0A831PPL4_9EURY|nr:SLC13 family permease [Methanofollis liminatans]